ncbi:hypothetical protein AB0T83_10430 [Fluviibacterium sp. DFM31]|uniref:Phage holin family protein n=1 Tax=Meridianimarinicoccus marinus TaxID=3231483 RepID=A0ABV3L6H9_9RHOB
MAGVVSGLEARLRRTVRSAAFGVAGVVFGAVGLGLLSAAVWILIASHHGALVACVVLGLLFLALGAGFLAAGAWSPPAPSHKTPPPPPAAPGDPFIRIAEGFATGMQAGRAARKGRR